MPEFMDFDPAYKGEAPIRGPSQTQVAEFDDLGVRGGWPRLIKLNPQVEQRLREWLNEEIQAFNLERAPLLEEWQRNQDLYWAKPAQKEKNFPFRKAANIVVPLAAIAVDAVCARLLNVQYSVEPYYSIRPRSKEWIQAAKPFEKYLQTEVESPNGLNMYEFDQDCTLELCKLGTVVAKSGYEKLTKKSLRKVGDREEDFYVTVKDGPTIERVPLGNFIMRLSEQDPQTAPLVGEKHQFTWSQLKAYAQDGRMRAEVVEEIKKNHVLRNHSGEPNDGGQLQQHVEELANVEPKWTSVFDVYEFWLTFDVNNDGWDEEIVVDFHKETGKFLSVRYNWYDDLHRPYRICQYQKVEGIWVGIGLCKQTDQFQIEVTTMHRQRLDNATLANMTQIVMRKNMGYGPGEPIFPGKMWFVDDPMRDMAPFKLSEIYPSSYANEETTIRYWQQLSSINDVTVGLPQQGTPGTATSDLTRLAESNKKFDMVMKNYRRFKSLLGSDIVVNMQIFGSQQKHWLVEGEDGIWVEMILNMPSTLIRNGAIIDLTVTDSTTNRDVEQRQWMQLFTIITNYYNQVLQLAQLFGPEIFIPVAQRALLTSDEALRRLLETFTIPDSDRFSLVEENPLVQSQNGNGNSPLSGNGASGQIENGGFAGFGQPAPASGMGNIQTNP